MSLGPDEDGALALDGQRDYYRHRRPGRIRPAATASSRRHFEELARRVDLRPTDRVCEWGAGLGRFTRFFAERVAQVTATELSPDLGRELREEVADLPHVRVEIGDALAAPRGEGYDLVAGFFVVHHFPSLAPYLDAARALLRPGGRFAFVEPNPWNPLYALQLTFTPGMRWRHERGLYRLHPAALRRAAPGARLELHRYGALPGFVYDALARRGVERWPERLVPSPLRAFQVIFGWKRPPS